MKNLFSVLLFFSLSVLSNGQRGFDPGYIVTPGTDTIRGFIRLQSNYQNSQECIFMKPGESSSHSYSPGELIAYRIENKKYYVARDVKIDSTSSKKLFLEFLVNGIVDLYYLKDLKNEYFFLDNGQSLIQLDNNVRRFTKLVDEGTTNEHTATYDQPSNQYKRMMAVLFQDSPPVLSRLQGTSFSYKSLVNITVDYHNSVCKDQKCYNYVKTTGRTIYLEAVAGFRFERMGLAQSDQSTASSAIGAGFNFRFKPFKGYSKWDLLVGLGYSGSNFDGIYKTTLESRTDPPYVSTFRVKASYSALFLPVTGEYTFNIRNLKPFFSIGLINGYIIPRDYYFQNVNQAVAPGKGPWRKYQVGASTSFGIRIMNKSGSYYILRTELSYRRPTADFGYLFDKTNFTAWSMGVAYGFRLK